MRKVLFIWFLGLTVMSYGQLDTLNTVGGGLAGGDSRKAAYEKINDAILKTNTFSDSIITDSVNTRIITADSADIEVDIVDSLDARVGVVDSLIVQSIRYSRVYTDDLRVPLTNTKINPTKSEPIFEDIGNGVLAWGFDANNDSTEANHFIAQTPHGWNNTALDAHLHWTVPDGNSGNVVWKLYYSIADVTGVFSAVDSLRVVAAAPGVAYTHVLTDLGDIDVTGITGVSMIIMGNVARLGDATEDTYASSAYGLEIDFHYHFDRPGSEEEYERY